MFDLSKYFFFRRTVSQITKLEIYESSINILDDKFLDKYVFKTVKQILIYDSYLGSIDDRLFVDFKSVDTVFLKLTNFKMFFQSAEWINFLNVSALADLNRQILVGFVDDNLSNRYMFPNEDLCLFKSFPHEQRVFVYVSSSVKKYDCTCTLLYLLKNWQSYRAFGLSNPSIEDCLKPDVFNTTIKECNLEESVIKW